MMRKPKVVILGTGGTIAGKAGSNTEMTGYQAGEIGIQTLSTLAMATSLSSFGALTPRSTTLIWSTL